MFTSPVVSLTMLSERTAGHARGCLLCVAEDGTIGLIVLDGLELSVRSTEGLSYLLLVFAD